MAGSNGSESYGSPVRLSTVAIHQAVVVFGHEDIPEALRTVTRPTYKFNVLQGLGGQILPQSKRLWKLTEAVVFFL